MLFTCHFSRKDSNYKSKLEKNFNLLFFQVLSFIDSPKRSIAGSSRNYIELMPNPRKRVRKALQLDDDGYSSFSGTASERFRSASINSSTAPLWKNAQSSLNSCVAKDFEREQHDSKSKEHVKNEPATTETASSDDFFIKNEPVRIFY